MPYLRQPDKTNKSYTSSSLETSRSGHPPSLTFRIGPIIPISVVGFGRRPARHQLDDSQPAAGPPEGERRLYSALIMIAYSRLRERQPATLRENRVEEPPQPKLTGPESRTGREGVLTTPSPARGTG